MPSAGHVQIPTTACPLCYYVTLFPFDFVPSSPSPASVGRCLVPVHCWLCLCYGTVPVSILLCALPPLSWSATCQNQEKKNALNPLCFFQFQWGVSLGALHFPSLLRTTVSCIFVPLSTGEVFTSSLLKCPPARTGRGKGGAGPPVFQFQ